MADQRKSAKVEQAELELTTFKSATPGLDFGDGFSNEALEQLIEETRQAVRDFNMAAMTLEEKRILIREKEEAISDMTKRLRMGVGAKFGSNSREYKLVNQVSKRKGKPKEKPASSDAGSSSAETSTTDSSMS